jgi:hypothetical protein
MNSEIRPVSADMLKIRRQRASQIIEPNELLILRSDSIVSIREVEQYRYEGPGLDKLCHSDLPFLSAIFRRLISDTSELRA